MKPLNTTDFNTDTDEVPHAELANLAAMARSIFHQVGATESAQPELTTLVNFNGANGANPFEWLYGPVGSQMRDSPQMATVATLYTFTNTGPGQIPVGGLLVDAAGDLFGTTAFGGAGVGILFELVNNGDGSFTFSTLVSFNGSDGAYPEGTLIADTKGDLFGTTYGGGTTNSDGTVFEILKTSAGYASTPITLVNFDGSNGAGPIAGLTADAAGNLFGTTAFGGAADRGTVFEIPKNTAGYGALIMLASFTGGNGLYPSGTLISDAAGNLFGTAQNGGAYGSGTVFELVKNSGSYSFSTLVNFNYTNGFDPAGGLVLDAAGNLFGTTYSGGAYDQGTVFEIPKTSAGYVSTPITLYNFSGGNGPKAGLTIDTVGDLFGITLSGTAFELINNDGSYTYKSIASGIGGNPQAALAADAFGDLFGTAPNGGPSGYGSLFEITGSGFIPPTTTIIRGNDDNISVFADNTNGYTIIIGNGSNDFVSALDSRFDKITLGNGADDTVQAFTSSHDKITLGNGADDTVYADCSNHDKIILGNGAGDRVDADIDNFGLVSSYNTITLGNGAGDAVDANSSNHDRITLGNGDRDIVYADGNNHDAITLGNGAGDRVDADTNSFGLVSSYDKITLGNGAGDAVDANSSNHDKIILGNGTRDTVYADGSSHDKITLGNGAGDTVSGNGSSYDTITVGNGQRDTVHANHINHDTIILGNGAGDTVGVFNSIADTITIGNGASDFVQLGDFFLLGTRHITLTLGNGAGDGVFMFDGNANTITLGNGTGDSVFGQSEDTGTNQKITLGNGAGDTVFDQTIGAAAGVNDKVTLGDGAGDVVNIDALGATITLGNGDVVNIGAGGFFARLGEGTISLGNGNNDIVRASQTTDSKITVGNGNDTIYVGRNDTVTVGTGHDSFIFQQTTPGNIGAVTVNHFDPDKDIFTFSSQLTTSVSYHDNAQGNAVVTVDNSGDTITLVGVHASELHPSNFHFVDPAAVPAIARTAQMVADLHAHNIL